MVEPSSEARRPLILLVDDEAALHQAIAYNLRREGWAVEIAEDGPSALSKARSLRPDLIILDVMLPGLDGFQVLRRVRMESNVPILFLSARAEEVDRVLGLELGGDDYLTKPFAMRELIARVRAMLRRAQVMPNGTEQDRMETVAAAVSAVPETRVASTLSAGGLTVDLPRREARLDGAPLTLKPKEFDLLAYLMRHPGIVLSREALLREVWGYDVPIDTRTVDVHIRWLRQKLGEEASGRRWIETVRGHGYRFVASE